MLQLTGKCMDREKAVELFEMLADNIPEEVKNDEFCDEYEAALNTFRYLVLRDIGVKPVFHKGKSIRDYYTCGKCGASIDIKDDFCAGCGRPIKWDNPRCLTDYKECEENAS